ncbi:MAG TPA: ABC transporter ATP-binding protein [Candidatus Latescibacteria bacterium]|nr:ABC transporter ATP-binding protein [Candidatus Latescibacterota bacterium]
MLKTVDLSKRYENGVLAVKGLNLHVKGGEIFTMLGANGAGKTTTINLMFNFTEPTEGQVLVHDIDVNRDPLKAKRHMAYVSENVMLYGNFTALQNIDFFAKLGGRKDVTRDEYYEVLRRVGLPEECFRRRLKTFSKGMRQKCGIAIAIIKDADVILLDEPTSGLDPKSGREFLGLLHQLKEEGKAIFMTTHDIFRAKEIADRVGIMTQGSMVREIPREEIVGANLEEIYMEYIERYENNTSGN